MPNINLVPVDAKKHLINFWKEVRASIFDMRLRTKKILDHKEEVFTDETTILLLETKRKIFVDMFMPSNTGSYFRDPDRSTLKQHFVFITQIEKNIEKLNNIIGDKEFVAFLMLGGFESKINNQTSVSGLFGGDILKDKDAILKSYLAKFDYSNFDNVKESIIENFDPLLDAESDFWNEQIDGEIIALLKSVSYADLFNNLTVFCKKKIKLVHDNNIADYESIVDFIPTEKTETIRRAKQEPEKSNIKLSLSNFDIASKLIEKNFQKEESTDASGIYPKFFELVKQKTMNK